MREPGDEVNGPPGPSHMREDVLELGGKVNNVLGTGR